MIIKIIKMMVKRLRCKHEHILYTNEEWSVFGTEHITKVCMDCGKRIY